MIFTLGCMFCFYLVVKGAEVYITALVSDPEQKTNGVKIATAVMFACFVAAAGFLFWLNYQSTHSRDIPAALFGATGR